MRHIWGVLDLSGGNKDWISKGSAVTGVSVDSGPSWCLGLSDSSVFADIESDTPARTDSLIVAGQLELHGTRDLARALSVDSDSSQPSNASLVLKAYQKWGADCPAYMYGEFAFAIFDSARKQLFLSVDHFATTQLCYWQDGSRFAFASDLGLLLRIPGVPRELNRSKLASLLLWGEATDPNQDTMHAHIRSVAPGTSLTVGGGGIRSHTFWEPRIVDALIPKREEDAFDALRELLFESVRNRLEGRPNVASLLSGGLDSSSVTALAAHCLASDNKQLLAVSSVSANSPAGRMPDERDFIEEFRGWPNIRLEFIDAPSRGPFDRLGDLKRYESGITFSSRQFLYEEFDSAALAHNADVLLDGSFGEFSATNWGDGYYLELACSLQWRKLISELKNSTPPEAPACLRNRAVRAFGSECYNWLLPSRRKQDPIMLLTDGFRMENRFPAAARRIVSQPRLHRESVAGWMRRSPNRICALALARVKKSYPLLDKRVIEFCISAPGRMKVRGGYPRYLIRRALNGILPRRIQWRTSKMPFSPDYFARYNAQLRMARNFVAAIRPNDPVRSIVDVTRLSLLLEPVHPVQGSWDALVTVPSTLYLICFLRQFAEFR